MRTIVTLIILIFLFIATTSAIPADLEKKVYSAIKVNPHPPVIDGLLTDLIWEKADWAADFTQREPYENQPPSEKTAFKIVYDEKNLYVGIRAYDREPDKIVRRMSRRDGFEGDWVEINIDSYHDQRTAFSFTVSAAGVQGDEAITNDGDNWDTTWDPIWQVKTASDDSGWSAEMKIPFSQLRFADKTEQVWGLQVQRRLYRKEERSLWQFIPRDSPGWVHRFGELRGITGIKPSRRIELLPYSLSQLEKTPREIGNPFATGQSSRLGLGLDGKFGLTSDLTVDFCVNPDFGQVEADPSEVNLTAFETFYEEKRPFFIEGRNILNYQLMMGDGDFSFDNLFYSRRIGQPPSYEPEARAGEYVDLPNNTTIINAIKLTGKTRSGLSVGILDAITARENATIDQSGKRRQIAVEPTTNYFLSRLQKDWHDGNTMIGGIVTNTYRNINQDHLEFLNSKATTGGVDFKQLWKNKTCFFEFNSVFSQIQGTRAAMLAAQTASSRYFQRPDADHLNLDSTRTQLSGYGGSANFGKFGGGPISFVLGSTWRSPGLELNDMGYLRQADVIMQFFWAQYRIWQPFSIFREIRMNINQWRGWNFAAENIFDGGNVNFNGQLKNYWSFGMGIGFNGESLSASALRGGPALITPSRWNLWFNLNTDRRKVFQLGTNGTINWVNDDFSRFISIRPNVRWRPSDAISLTLNPFYSINKNNLQYVNTFTFAGEDRYLFGRLEQKTLGLVLRVDYTITPHLTVQYYGQPFISAGTFSQFKRIRQPRANRYADRFHNFTNSEIDYVAADKIYRIDENNDGSEDYRLDLPDFNFRQFRSNLVIRWQYSPGSTVYLVWTQERTGSTDAGTMDWRGDVNDLFSVDPNNVFLIKFNYWLSR